MFMNVQLKIWGKVESRQQLTMLSIGIFNSVAIFDFSWSVRGVDQPHVDNKAPIFHN